MKVIRLSLKCTVGKQLEERDRLILQRGYGIVGDTHALPGSPRQVLLVETSTLQQFDLQPGQLQENLLVEGVTTNLMSGQTLQIGEEALVRLTGLCEPCAMLNTLHPGLAKRIRGKRGMLGMVVRDGLIEVGDRITLTSHQFPVIPDTTRGKFEEFVSRIPNGQVVRTPDLLLALGLTNSYYRVIPTFIKTSMNLTFLLPVHRIVATQGKLLTQFIPHQIQALLGEGIQIEGDRVLEQFYWNPIKFHELGEF